MKRALLHITIFLLMLMVLGSGCRKERKPRVYKVEQYLKDWMFFDTGTWWLYQDIKTGITDSQYVVESALDHYTSENIKGQPYYTDESAIVSINRNYVFAIASPKGSSLVQKMELQSSEQGSTFLLFKPLLVGQGITSSGLGFTEIKQIDPHFTLDNTNYDTLITLYNNYDLSEHNDSVEYRVLKGVGIISKKNLSKNQHWQLIKYHINLNKQ